MKRTTLTIALILLSTICIGQTYQFEAGASTGLDDRSKYAYSANFTGRYDFENLSLGLGVGIEKSEIAYARVATTFFESERLLLPIFVRGQYKFNKDGNTPFFALDIGYSQELKNDIDDSRTGFFISPQLGKTFGSFYASAYLKFQSMQFRENLTKTNKWTSFAGLRIGFEF